MKTVIGFWDHVQRESVAELMRHLPKEITNVTRDIRIEVVPRNVTLLLGPFQWYCKVAVFEGGPTTLSWDLYQPSDPIVFFFIEDLELEHADNFSDVVIRLNRTQDGRYTEYRGVAVTCAIWTQGAFEKKIYWKDRLIHHHPKQKYSCTILY